MATKKPKTVTKAPESKPESTSEVFQTDTRALHTWSCPPLMGRPPLYPKPEDLAKKIAQYFDEGCIRETEIYFNGVPTVTKHRIPTISGLATFCGFSCRDTFYKQGERGDDFFYIVKWARSNIESFHEENIASGAPCTGSIWWTKCHADWKDTSGDNGDKSEAPRYAIIVEGMK